MEPCMLLEMGDETQIEGLVSSNRYWFEVKKDGARAIVSTEADRVKANGGVGRYCVIGRSWENLSGKFPELAALGEKLPPESRIDGEIFVPLHSGNKDKPTTSGRTSAGDCARRAKLAPAVFCAFDCLLWDGLHLETRRIEERKQYLEGLQGCPGVEIIRPLEDPLKEWQRIRQDNDEGLVAKLKGSPYVYRRSDLWLKLKNWHTDDLRILGYTSEKRDISALVLEGGYKVNFGVKGSEYLKYLKAFEKTGKVFWTNNGKEAYYEIKPGFRAELRYLNKSATGLRFPILAKIDEVKI